MGGGPDGSEGSPHESRRNFTASAEILRYPRAHPPIAQDDKNLQWFFAQVQRSRCEKAQNDTNFCLGDFFNLRVNSSSSCVAFDVPSTPPHGAIPSTSSGAIGEQIVTRIDTPSFDSISRP